MKLIVFVAIMFIATVAAADGPIGGGRPQGDNLPREPCPCHLTPWPPNPPPVTPVYDVRACPQAESSDQCGSHCIVDINSRIVGGPDWRWILKEALERCNTTVRLGPDVELDFSPGEGKDLRPLKFGRCVTLTSVSDFNAPTPTPARTPRTRGPVLKYGLKSGEAKTLLGIPLHDPVNQGLCNHIRISGFRLEGPTIDQQSGSDVGIRIDGCTDVEISNMEIYGWGASGILVQNTGRRHIVGFDTVRIHDNFIHHNQHPSIGGALGYGIEVSSNARAHIYRNVFDFNRHAIAAAGNTYGYVAEENLVLKGGGWHGRSGNLYTHQFDVHGTDKLCFPIFGCITGYGGQAGSEFQFYRNSFQYSVDNAIHIRGRPDLCCTYIDENVFPHESYWDAIRLHTFENIEIGRGNTYETDTFGEYYSQADFDGDGIDDLFLATGETWWYSSSGKFPWTFLNTSSTRIKDLRFGYFDDDNLCDVVSESGGPGGWIISSGGTDAWKPLEQVWLAQPSPGIWRYPLKDVRFGRFDPRDHRHSRQTTHAFYRAPNGEWHVKKLNLSKPGSDWENVGGARIPLSNLRFGDFTGDGVTDVLAIERGRWAYSESARERWRPLNRSLSDPVAGLFITNMDPDDNIDDILRLDVRSKTIAGCQGAEDVDLIWSRSRNGTDRWREFKRYSFRYSPSYTVCYQPEPGVGYVYPRLGFVGRFGVVSGGTLTVDERRIGHFYSPGSTPQEWTSLFPH